MSTAHRVTFAIAAAIGAAGVVLAVAGPAEAGPQIRCVGAKCTNKGDAVGIGHGMYTCPGGLQIPSIAIVPPKSTAFVLPTQCGGGPNLYGPGPMGAMPMNP
ncbi:MAG: hypothetical protein QM728_01020 [Gordonia sp. (in: high G+C Gram-positive bacteria)]|uniref:hypothetical protein n=1 Tax=Gordonia sp. (in: high G+C Gram-positive bacteria) TaxID=84139 RepID=UPI0039E58119